MQKVTSIFRPRLSREAFYAYVDRLPTNIKVNWFRDGNFIVGEVNADGKHFFTQGKNADDFVEMVNDAVVTVLGIPNQYYDVVRRTRTYMPPSDELEKLNNVSIKKSAISFLKNTKALRLLVN